MANPEQQGLKQYSDDDLFGFVLAEMANPEQQGLKHPATSALEARSERPKWLIQNNKD